MIRLYLLVEHEEEYLNQEWDLVIFDEAQNMKNIASQRARVARLLKAKARYALSGTPMENHWGEFFSVLDLVCPGSLGPWEQFKKRFLSEAGPSMSEITALRERIRPLVLRRTKQEVLLQLPEKTETRMLLDFETTQKKLYRDTALSWSNKVKSSIQELGENKSQLHMLTALMRLRQICSDPCGAVEGVSYSKIPPKLEWLLEKCLTLHDVGETALIFGQFVNTLERVKVFLEKAGLRTYLITGSVPKKKREEILYAFRNDQGARFLLMTLKTGGVGLNLTEASHVIHLDPWWNPAAENQATDRAHRMGQQNKVQVQRLYMRHSVEEKMETLQARKQASFDALFGEAYADESMEFKPGAQLSKGKLSQGDFESLLGS